MADMIDREQALGCFYNYANNDGTGYDETEMPAYDRLQALPSIEYDDDCISRQAAIDAMRKYEIELPIYAPRETDIFWNDAIDACCDAIEALPSAQSDNEKRTAESAQNVPNGELISKKAAIDAVVKESQIDGAYGYMDTKSIVDLLSDLPPAQSEQRWIPCSERLPDDDATVLITHKGGMSFGWYNGKYWERGANTKHRPLQTVIAWMPLPQPWEGGQDDECSQVSERKESDV